MNFYRLFYTASTSVGLAASLYATSAYARSTKIYAQPQPKSPLTPTAFDVRSESPTSSRGAPIAYDPHEPVEASGGDLRVPACPRPILETFTNECSELNKTHRTIVFSDSSDDDNLVIIESDEAEEIAESTGSDPFNPKFPAHLDTPDSPEEEICDPQETPEWKPTVGDWYKPKKCEKTTPSLHPADRTCSIVVPKSPDEEPSIPFPESETPDWKQTVGDWFNRGIHPRQTLGLEHDDPEIAEGSYQQHSKPSISQDIPIEESENVFLLTSTTLPEHYKPGKRGRESESPIETSLAKRVKTATEEPDDTEAEISYQEELTGQFPVRRRRIPRRGTYNWKPFEFGGSIFPHPKFDRRNIIEYADFAVCFDNVTKSPCWTLEVVNKRQIESLRWESAEDRAERLIPPEFRAGLADYASVKYFYKIQHLAEVDYHKILGTDDVTRASVYTNVVPQAVDCARMCKSTVWDEIYDRVERFAKFNECIVMLTGPLYLPENDSDGRKIVRCELIGPQKVPVPTHFFKVLLGHTWDNHYFLECYKFRNAVHEFIDLSNYRVTREELERDSGFMIFRLLDDSLISNEDPFPPLSSEEEAGSSSFQLLEFSSP